MTGARPSLLRAATALLVAIALAGCAGSTPTPIIVVVTPHPTPSPIVIYVTPEPTAAPTATPEATPTQQVTPTADVTPTAAAAATSRAAMCSGNDTNKAFFAEAAAKLSFAVYCAVLPSSWWVEGGQYVLPGGGFVGVTYKNSAGATIELREGNACPTGCVLSGAYVGPALFGDLSGSMFVSGGYYGVVVGTMPNPDYIMSSSGVSKSNLTAWGAALRKVPRH